MIAIMMIKANSPAIAGIKYVSATDGSMEAGVAVVKGCSETYVEVPADELPYDAEPLKVAIMLY
jgi:hypothetical protein